MDWRVSAARIADVIGRLDADIVAVQEIRRGTNPSNAESDQVAFLARVLGYHAAFGENKLRWGAPYGNATFSRFPIVFEQNYDLTIRGQERRGCLRADVRAPYGRRLHVYNLHLSTRYFARPRQARHLLSDSVVNHPAVTGRGSSSATSTSGRGAWPRGSWASTSSRSTCASSAGAGRIPGCSRSSISTTSTSIPR